MLPSPDSATSGSPAVGLRLSPKPEPLRQFLANVWRSRDLMRMLARQDFFVRYRRASFGFLWAVAIPLMQAIVLAVVFTRVVRIETGTSYPVFVFSGLLPWSFFAGCISGASTSIVDGQGLATKIYFPRAVLPLVTVRAMLYGFLPGLGVLVVMIIVLGADFGPALLYLIPGTVLIVLLGASFALVLSALHVYFRDVRYFVGAITFAWFYATPILYPLSLAPPSVRWVIEANPATGCIELFRAAIGVPNAGWGTTVLVSCCWVAVLLAVAVELHRRFDRLFVDLL